MIAINENKKGMSKGKPSNHPNLSKITLTGVMKISVVPIRKRITELSSSVINQLATARQSMRISMASRRTLTVFFNRKRNAKSLMLLKYRTLRRP